MTAKITFTFRFIAAIGSISGVIGLYGLYLSGNVIETSNNISSFSLNSGKAANENLMLRRFEKDFFLNIGNIKSQNKYIKKYNNSYDRIKSYISSLKNFSDKYPHLLDQEALLCEVLKFKVDYN